MNKRKRTPRKGVQATQGNEKSVDTKSEVEQKAKSASTSLKSKFEAEAAPRAQEADLNKEKRVVQKKTELPAETSEDTQLVESEDTKSIESDSDTADFDITAQEILKPSKLTARQKSMLNLENQLEYGGGLDDLFSRPKKELTEEQMIRKAEQNEERRRKNQKLRKEQQAAAQQSIREGKGAKAKREDKRNEAREIREAQRRTGKEIPEGIIRLSLTKNSNSVIWHRDLDIPERLKQPERTCPVPKTDIVLVRVPKNLSSIEGLRAGCSVSIKRSKGEHRVYTVEDNHLLGAIPKSRAKSIKSDPLLKTIVKSLSINNNFISICIK